jgi:glycerol-3-phosphate dehydrogenase (NAD(P)+)
MNKKITLLGAGAWGTSMANTLAQNGYNVTLWCFEQEVVDDIVANRLNKKYLPGIELDEKITATSSLHDALESGEIIFQAIPVPYLRDVLFEAKSLVKKDHKWVVLSKGVENKTLLLPSQIICDVFGYEPKIAVLSGPNFAIQLAEKKYTASVVASKDKKFSQEIKTICENKFFKIFESDDPLGVQAGAALKNVISMFLGILDGFACAENTKAYFLTCGFEEIVLLAKRYGGRQETVYGLSGLGDLVLGLLGKKNRNYRFGEMIGEGNSLAELSDMGGSASEMGVLPEGVGTVKSIYQLMKSENLELPVCLAAYQIIFEGRSDIKSFF